MPLIFCASLAGCAPQQNAPTDEKPAITADTNATPAFRETTLGPVHAVVELSNAHPTLGDPIRLSLTVDADSVVAVVMPDFGDQLGKFSIADYKATDTVREDGRNEYKQLYTLDLPMSGNLRTPSFLVEFTDNRQDSEQKGKLQELLTEEIPFEVASVFADGQVQEDLYPALGTLDELVLPSSEKTNWTLWSLLGLAGAAAIGAFVLLRAKKAQKPALPPDVVALSAIGDMEKAAIPTDAREIDAWYVKLSGIMRTYVEDRFSLHAPRLTTEEFFELAKDFKALKEDEKFLIRRLLERSDRVKFANYLPTEKESSDMLVDARAFVEKTRELSDAHAQNTTVVVKHSKSSASA